MPSFQPLLSRLDITLFANTRSASYSIQGAKGVPFESKMLSEKLSISNIPQVTRRGGQIVTQDRQTLSIWFPTNVPLREADLKLDEKNNPNSLPDIAILFNQRKMRLLSKKLAKKNNSGVVPVPFPPQPAATAATAAATAAARIAEATADAKAVTTFTVNVKKIIDITHKNIEVILKKLFKNPITITISNKKYIIREYKWLKSLYPPYGYKIRNATGNIWPVNAFIEHTPGTMVSLDGHGGLMQPSMAMRRADPGIAAAPVPLENHRRTGVIFPQVDTRPNYVWVKFTNAARTAGGPIRKDTIWEVPIPDIRVLDPYPRYKPRDDPDYDDDDDDDDAEEDIRIIPQREWGTPGNSEKWWKQRVVDWAHENTSVGGRSAGGPCNRFWKIIPPQYLGPGGRPPEPITNEIERDSNHCSFELYPSTQNGLTFQIICELTIIPDNGYHAAISKRNKEAKRNKASRKKTAKKHFGENCRDSAAEIKEIQRGRKVTTNKNKMVGGTRRRGTRRRGTRRRGTRR
jgi:hypothetical protein